MAKGVNYGLRLYAVPSASCLIPSLCFVYYCQRPVFKHVQYTALSCGLKTNFHISVKQGIRLIQFVNNRLYIQPASLSPTKVVPFCNLRHVQLQSTIFSVFISGIIRDIITVMFVNITICIYIFQPYKITYFVTLHTRYVFQY